MCIPTAEAMQVTKSSVTVMMFALGLGALWARGADLKTPEFRVDVNMVQLRTTVTDAAGHYIRSLTKDNFRVLENGVPQKIDRLATPAARGNSQTTVFVLFDTSDQMYNTFSYAEDAVADFIRGLDPADAVAVYSFSRNVTRLAPAGMDRFATIKGLRHAVLGDNTGLYDAILLTLRDAGKVAGSKVIVVFSNGPDNASVLAPDDVRGVAEDEGVPIYVVSTQDQNAISNAVFSDLSGSTGGRLYFARTWRREKAAFRSIDDDLNNSYVISYYPRSNGSAGYRKIDVEISGEARIYRVRARAGYRPKVARSQKPEVSSQKPGAQRQ